MGTPIKAWVRALEATAPVERHQTPILPLLIEELAARFEACPALESRSGTLSYRELAQLAQRCARWGLAQGLKPGDAVGLLMPNCPAYLGIWLGLSRIGVVSALLNTNLEGALLAQAIMAVASRHVIAAGAPLEALAGVRSHLPSGVRCWAWGAAPAGVPRMDQAVESLPAGPVSEAERAVPALEDRALYIYTSGTTGLPKAANVSHMRLLQWTHWFAGMMDITPADRLYNCLPMYHSIGGVVAIGAPLVAGGTVVLRERFSAREFWPDVVSERCTLFQYIGELCRYLVASPPHPLECAHTLRLCCGNGLRADVWQEFQRRFRIPQILEYYAATEASFSLYNCEGRPGAIGKIPAFLSHRVPVALVRFDTESAMPLRNAAGHCERCEANEIGEALGRVADGISDPGGRFEGYADAEASKSKVLRDVFASGDAWYRTGDLMRQDELGFFYFVDRVGDTFRWKGENVSTLEVSSVVTSCPGVLDAVVFGVSVPRHEGRAGMAALVVDSGFDLESFTARLGGTLPDYARPLFLRIVAAIELTGTFRHRARELARQAFDPSEVRDPLYCYDRAQDAYIGLDPALFARICAGQLRL